MSQYDCFPFQGEVLFFKDNRRRIDFVLAWDTRHKNDEAHSNLRKTFEKNLRQEGLHLEYDKKVSAWCRPAGCCLSLSFNTGVPWVTG